MPRKIERDTVEGRPCAEHRKVQLQAQCDIMQKQQTRAKLKRLVTRVIFKFSQLGPLGMPSSWRLLPWLRSWER